MQIKLLKPGILSTLQDLGRTGYRAQAVPLAGAMDRLAARLANIAIGNAENAAVIEFTYADALFVTDQDCLMAYAGGGAALTIDGVLLPSNRPLFIPAGAKVDLTYQAMGCRLYLAIAGGWEAPSVLGSQSTYLMAGFGGYEGRALQSNDVLRNQAPLSLLNERILEFLGSQVVNFPKWSVGLGVLSSESTFIRVVPAQEFTWFDSDSIFNFLTQPFSISTQSNRMGYQLSGVQMQRIKSEELLSTAVTMGTVQVTGSGQLVILMADAQTTGGYPRIAQVAAVDLSICAQMKPNQQVFFKEISRQEAETLYIQRERELQQLTTAICLKI